MPQVDEVLKQIDAVLSAYENLSRRAQCKDFSDLGDIVISEIVMSLRATIERFSPPGSAYRKQASAILEENGARALFAAHAGLCGVLRSLRTAYAQDYLRTVEELVHADIFSDFLEMADYLLREGYKDPAAVLVGGVLEEHLRKLCDKCSLPHTDANGKPLRASQMNDALAKAVYDKLQQKTITALLDLRNKAAHGKYAEYDEKDVHHMLDWVRDFLIKFPA
ncbi:MAG: hypothetical protein AB1700_16475 [Bacillota bacterium]